jgi:tetratricopeptide (TPR) repeat protein
VFSWEALIRCLYKGEYYEEALEQVRSALKLTDSKPIFYFYLSAVYLELGKSKEAMLQLEKAMSKAPKLLKKLVDLNPSILQNQQVIDIVARYKRNKSI